MIKRSELLELAGHAEHIELYEKIIPMLDDGEAEVKITLNYDTTKINGTPEFTGEIKECIKSFLVDRKAELLKLLEDKRIDIHR